MARYGRSVWVPYDIDDCIKKSETNSIVRPILRFNVGDRVDCCLNSNHFEEDWGSGTIVMRNWEIVKEDDTEEIVPYRIRLDNGDVVSAPVDADDCIKRSSTPAVNVKSFKLGSHVECLRNGEWSSGTVTQSNPNWLEVDPVESGPYYIQYDSEPIGNISIEKV